MERIYTSIARKAAKITRRLVARFRRLAGIDYRSTLDESAVFAFLEGKSVAIVGNAASLSEESWGADIDRCDLVIRFNRMPIPGAVSHGIRTDVIATSIEIERSAFVERGASQIWWMSPRREGIPRWMERSPHFFLYPKTRYAELQSLVAERPTTGLMVIELLSRAPCRAIGIFGFDFFHSASLSQTKSRYRMPHDPKAEEQFVEKLLASDPRFHLHRPGAAARS